MFEKIKKKIWIRKILKEDQNAISSISCDVYLHEDDKKAMEYYNKSNTFFKLFNEEETYNQSMKHQKEIYGNINA